MLFQNSLRITALLGAFCTSMAEAGSAMGIKYADIGFSGSYKDVTSMDGSTCSCQQEEHSFSGTFAPLNEELSVHFRGPVKLQQFAVYYPAGGSQSKRDIAGGDCVEKVVRHKHKRDVVVQTQKVTSVVVVPYSGAIEPTGGAASGDGSPSAYTVISTVVAAGPSIPSGGAFVSESASGSMPTPSAGVPSSGAPSSSSSVPLSTGAPSSGSSVPLSTGVPSLGSSVPSSYSAPSLGNSVPSSYSAPSSGSSVPSSSSAPSSGSSVAVSSSTSSSDTPSSSSGSSSGGSGSWSRSAYYTPGNADGLVFMNQHGGSGSGVWDKCFGNSISFASEDGQSAASSATALGDVTFKSDQEFMIFSDNQCDGYDCGFYREGIPAYHGFGGSDKIFVFEFTMPNDDSGGYNNDMPAIWLLNAKIPRTLQYGNQDCSCWKSGCGELDLFEILSSGSDQLISHLHDGRGSGSDSNSGGGGSSDYFTRPTENSLKAAVVFDSNTNSIQLVEVDDDFGSTLDGSTVNSWLDKATSKANLV